ncbi:MAG: tetratricopeptide repeat protein [Candidatus Thermoplasmatota archaeon]|nr:tetratricopeptide repeat protein [Candidatus Thermoplasmatota archaeon]MBU4070979.1 tetratricopeptide repeat protein [Candidatus Thermoplasmatota archaeon]MBU4145217.1 tetratricopeptide repeat protein [Candidatus Thermoplasmatota archaeon]MBU4591043.1 tetratricopeptide repeat protein [Candidatus Thermoplasmatota archaeon]
MLGWNPAPNRLISIINDMPQDEFDSVARKLLKEMRFNIVKSNSTGKFIDYEATRDDDGTGKMFIIRAARGNRRVTPEELQATVGKRSNGREMSPVYIATGGFTEEADKYAEMLNISLADGEKLDLLLKNFNMADEIEEKANKRIIENDGDRFLPSIDELENNMKWGNDFYASGNYKKAIEYYDTALRLKSQYDLAWLMKGNALSAIAWYDEAIECFKKALEYNPESEEAWYNLGATMYNLGRYDDEIACYDKALELRPDFTKAWNNKGATLHQMGKFEEAVMCYDKVLKFEPDNISVLNNRGVALKNLKNYDDALKSFDKALRKKEDYVDAWLNKGILLHDMERYPDAIVCYDYVLTKWKSPEVLCQRGVALAMLARYKQAIDSFDASLALKPGWSIAIEEKRKAEEAMKDDADGRARAEEERAARRLLEETKEIPKPEPVTVPLCRNCNRAVGVEAMFCSFCGISTDPDTEPAILPVGKPLQLEAIEEEESVREALDMEEYLLEKSSMLRSMGKKDDALKAINEALGYGEGPDLWLEKGNVLAVMGRAESAIEAYDRVLKSQPENIIALSNRELMLSALGKLDDALAVNNIITEIVTDDPHAWLRRATIMRKLGRVKETVECLDRVAELMPGLAEIWNAQGVALLELEKYDEGILCLDKAIQIDPDFSEAWNNKGAAMMAAGRTDKSLHYFDRAIDIDQDNHRAWANKAAALYEAGRFTEAVECLEEALTMTRNKFLLNNKGWALLAEDRIAEALEAFEEAIILDQEYAEAWNNRGLAHSRREDLTEAFDSFERALAIAPNFEDARKNRDATAKRIEHLAGKAPAKPEPMPSTKMKPEPEFKEAIEEAEVLEQEEIEAEEFKCPFCDALGSIDDVFCEKCGQKFTGPMKEDAVEEKLEHILDPEPKPKAEPKQGKKDTELLEELVTVPGVGYAKAGTIIDAGYDSAAKLKKATMGDLAGIPGISEGLARKIKKLYR